MASDNRHLLMLALMSLPIAAIAMTPLDDSGLADIRGQDGLTVNLESTDALQAQQLNWITDSGNAPAGACSGGVTDQHACTQLNGLTLQGDGNPLRAQLQLDVGSDGTVPLLALQYDWQPSLFTLDGITLQTGTNPAYAGHSLGQVALYSQGNLALVNQGIFSRNGQHANLDFSMTGDWIYRQGGAGSAEMSIGNLMIQNRFSNGPAGGHAPATGIIGIDSNGLLLEADHTYTALEFDLMYKAAPTNFDRTGRQPLIYGAWIGGLKDASVRVSAGGIGYGYDGTVPSGNWDYAGINTPRSEGLNIQTLGAWRINASIIPVSTRHCAVIAIADPTSRHPHTGVFETTNPGAVYQGLSTGAIKIGRCCLVHQIELQGGIGVIRLQQQTITVDTDDARGGRMPPSRTVAKPVLYHQIANAHLRTARSTLAVYPVTGHGKIQIGVLTIPAENPLVHQRQVALRIQRDLTQGVPRISRVGPGLQGDAVQGEKAGLPVILQCQ